MTAPSVTLSTMIAENWTFEQSWCHWINELTPEVRRVVMEHEAEWHEEVRSGVGSFGSILVQAQAIVTERHVCGCARCAAAGGA